MKFNPLKSLLDRVPVRKSLLMYAAGALGCVLAVAALVWLNALMSPRKPSVVLVICDTLRADHLGCYGYERNTTANIDKFSEKAVLFTNAYASAPCTIPSVWNIMMSQYQSLGPVKTKSATFATFCKALGYATGAVTANAYFMYDWASLSRGFDYYDPKCETDMHKLSTRRAASVTDSAIGWLKGIEPGPFFLWVFYFDPHDPYDPPPPFRGYYTHTEAFSRDRRGGGIHLSLLARDHRRITKKHKQFLIAAYDEEIRYFDYELGRLFDYLKDKGAYNDALIIITADHGEELGDNNRRWDHCMLLTQEELHVPFLIKLPGQKRRITIDSAVQNIDAFPTVADYMREDMARYKFEGKSLMPVISSWTKRDDERFAASFWKSQRSIVVDSLKYWLWNKRVICYDIKTGEKIQNDGIREKLDTILTGIYRKYVTKDLYYDRTVDHLKTLGYLQ